MAGASPRSAATAASLLAIVVGLVPVVGPRLEYLLDLGVVGIPSLNGLRIDARWHRGLRHGGKRAELDHQRLALTRQAPVEKQLGGIRVIRALGNPSAEDRDGDTLRSKEPLERCALSGQWNGEIGDQWRNRDLTADHGIDHLGLARKQRWFERRLLRPVVLAQHLAFEHGAIEGSAPRCDHGLAQTQLAEFGAHQISPRLRRVGHERGVVRYSPGVAGAWP